MKSRFVLVAVIASLFALKGWAYLSGSAPSSGNLFHDSLTLFSYGDLSALNLPEKITWDTYPDLVKFQQQIRVPGQFEIRTPGVCADSASFGTPLCLSANVEYAHFGTDGQVYWWGNENQWRLAREASYGVGHFQFAYQFLGYVVHLLQDSTVPAHSRVVFHGAPVMYPFAFPGGPALGNPPEWEGGLDDVRRPRADWFEYAASRMNLSDITTSGINTGNYLSYVACPPGLTCTVNGSDYSSRTATAYNTTFTSPMCQDQRKFWIYGSSTGDLAPKAWGAYGEPADDDDCDTPPRTSSDKDWYPDLLAFPALGYPAGPALHLAAGGLAAAVILTYYELTYTSKHLAPMVQILDAPSVANPVNFSINRLTLNFEVQENRTQKVRIAIKHKGTGKYINANLDGNPSAPIDGIQSGREFSLGSVDMDTADPKLPFHKTFTIVWDGSFGDGTSVASGIQQLDFQVLDADGNASDHATVTFAVAVPSNGSLSTTPDSVVPFGNVAVNSSPTSSVTIRNNGNTPFNITSLGINGGNSGVFSLSSSTVPQNIAPGASIQIGVKFVPAAATTYSATLYIGNDSANAGPMKYVTLSGTGAVAVTAPSAPQLIAPGTSNLPSQLLSSTTPVFSWTASDNASYYNIYVSQPPYGAAHLVSLLSKLG